MRTVDGHHVDTTVAPDERDPLAVRRPAGTEAGGELPSEPPAADGTGADDVDPGGTRVAAGLREDDAASVGRPRRVVREVVLAGFAVRRNGDCRPPARSDDVDVRV